MAEIVLSEKPPLAQWFVAGGHRAPGSEAGVALTTREGLAICAILSKRSRLAELARTIAALGLSLPGPGQALSRGGCRVLWSGPDLWTVIGLQAEVEQLAAACAAHALVVDQSDARAIVAVSGLRARVTLAKGVPIDLHERAFRPGMTAVTTVAGVAVQIWQTDETPTYELAVPRSFAEDFWAWLTHAAAEYGYDAVETN